MFAYRMIRTSAVLVFLFVFATQVASFGFGFHIPSASKRFQLQASAVTFRLSSSTRGRRIALSLRGGGNDEFLADVGVSKMSREGADTSCTVKGKLDPRAREVIVEDDGDGAHSDRGDVSEVTVGEMHLFYLLSWLLHKYDYGSYLAIDY